jgi:hypothetical protein
MRQRKRGYRADTAFDGEQTIPGGALVLVEDGVIIGLVPGSAPAPDGCEVTYLRAPRCFPVSSTPTPICAATAVPARWAGPT